MAVEDKDCAAFLCFLAETQQQQPLRLLAYCLMPNHWHLILWPAEDNHLSDFLRWLTLTHSQRWLAHYHCFGSGHVYQGRFKSFPVCCDEHLLTVCRYVERNALRKMGTVLTSYCCHVTYGNNVPPLSSAALGA